MHPDWINIFLDRARDLDLLPRLSDRFMDGWNRLEDDVLALSPAAQSDLFHAASYMARPGDIAPAMILLSMIPDAIIEQHRA